ncbi:hypothetical protein GCM10023156_58940 [Novipirellula rosea]|uniref:Uncharacterized protein n=1 Tax=Novipirellula rosea TaxID=1031540 RepID=A0ABP8NJL4_9BACT
MAPVAVEAIDSVIEGLSALGASIVDRENGFIDANVGRWFEHPVEKLTAEPAISEKSSAR